MNQGSGQEWEKFLQYGTKLFLDKSYLKAIEAFNKSIDLNESWNAYQGLGWSFFRVNAFPAAIEAFQKSIALHEDWNTYQGLGSALFRINAFPAAIEVFQKSISLREDWNTYRGLGWSLFRVNAFPAAIEVFQKSISLREDWNTYQGLGWALFRVKVFSFAIEAFKKSIALRDDWSTYQGLGSALFQVKNYPSAKEAFSKSLALHEDWSTYQGLGWSLFRLNAFPAAIEAFNKSLALHEDWGTYQGLGWSLFRINAFPVAIEAFNKSLALHEDWNTYRGLGLILCEMKDYLAALEALNKSNSLQEDFSTYKGIGVANLYRKNYRKALDATNSAFSMKRSREIENQFKDIYLQACNEEAIDQDLMSFFDCDDLSKTNQKKFSLKNYICSKDRTSKIDPIMLSHISFKVNNIIEGSIASSDQDLIDALKLNDCPSDIGLTHKSSLRRYIFGVSHSRLHAVSPNTTVIECGPGTMYSIGNPESRTKHFQKINSSIAALDPLKSVLIFEFGEIDIRNHIFKVSKNKSQSIYSTANASISNYINFLRIFLDRGYDVIICGPHCGGGESPSRVSSVERNDLCAYINDALSIECQKNGIYFYTLFDKVVDQKTLREISGLYSDEIHLCLPPSKIGYALNACANNRITRALSEASCSYQLLQQEEILAMCRLAFSDIPDFSSGMQFAPGILSDQKDICLPSGEYMLVIELPFLIYPKELELKFAKPMDGIEIRVQGVQEPWDVSQELISENILCSNSNQVGSSSRRNSSLHCFNAPQSMKEGMCRFFIVRISIPSAGNFLRSICMKRWLPLTTFLKNFSKDV